MNMTGGDDRVNNPKNTVEEGCAERDARINKGVPFRVNNPNGGQRSEKQHQLLPRERTREKTLIKIINGAGTHTVTAVAKPEIARA